MSHPGIEPSAAGHVDPIDCETAVRRLWDFLDGRLPASARAEVEEHLVTCTKCPPHFGFARSMQRTLAQPAPPSSSDDEARLTERVRDALRRHAVDSREDAQ